MVLAAKYLKSRSEKHGVLINDIEDHFGKKSRINSIFGHSIKEDEWKLVWWTINSLKTIARLDKDTIHRNRDDFNDWDWRYLNFIAKYNWNAEGNTVDQDRLLFKFFASMAPIHIASYKLIRHDNFYIGSTKQLELIINDWIDMVKKTMHITVPAPNSNKPFILLDTPMKKLLQSNRTVEPLDIVSVKKYGLAVYSTMKGIQ